jgi:hypothetical protein
MKVGSNKSEDQNEKNTVKYKRTRDEVYCEVSLSNEVGKEGINGLIQNLTNNQNIVYRRLNGAGAFSDEKIEIGDLSEDVISKPEPELKANENSSSRVDKTFPHISDLEINLNCNEATWILIYAFYESDFGKKTFTKVAVHTRYMASRKTESRSKNFSSSWKGLFKKYLATVNDKEIRFKQENLGILKDIISGNKTFTKSPKKLATTKKSKSDTEANETTIKESPKKVVKRSPGNGISYSIETDLDLHPRGKQSLKQFYDRYNVESNPESVLVIVYYLQKIIDHKSISENTIYTCYKHVALPVPNIRATLNNIHSRKGWINTKDFWNLTLTVAGENHVEHEIIKK